MANIALLMQILLPLLDRAAQISELLNKAHGENRDISDAELDQLFADDDEARAALDAAIKASKAP